MQSAKTLAERQRALFARIQKAEWRRAKVIEAQGVFPMYAEACDVVVAMTKDFPKKVKKPRTKPAERRKRTATRGECDAEIQRIADFFARRVGL